MSTQVTILGNTGRDVELRYTPQGTAVATFSVASNGTRKTSKGQEKKTDWYEVTAWGRQAETLKKYLKKGSQILVRGKLDLSAWETRSGEPRVNADVTLQDFEFVGGAAKTAENPVAEAAQTESAMMAAHVGDEMTGDALDASEISAEMLEALHGAEIGDEPFAGQF